MENDAVGGVHVCNASGRGNWGYPLNTSARSRGPYYPSKLHASLHTPGALYEGATQNLTAWQNVVMQACSTREWRKKRRMQTPRWGMRHEVTQQWAGKGEREAAFTTLAAGKFGAGWCANTSAVVC